MACANDPNRSTAAVDMKFIGPAQTKFGSLQEQAIQFLNDFWPNWKDYDQPQSYILPPVFYYKNRQISDKVINAVKEREGRKKQPHAVVLDRTSDNAEYILYAAIQQLIQERFRAPFIAVRGLNINNSKQCLAQCFPADWQATYSDCFREYDYVLIGPKIGVVVIEAKSSEFTQNNHFKRGFKHLPDGYKHGLHQLHSAEVLVRLIHECAEVQSADDVLVTKILFTSNLEESRYQAWKNSLALKDEQEVDRNVGDAEQWFQQDAINWRVDADKPPLYSKLKNRLQKCDAIPSALYQASAPFIAAMASVTVLPSKSAPDLCKIYFSEADAVLQEHESLTNSDLFKSPDLSHAATKLTKEMKLQNAAFEIIPECDSKVENKNETKPLAKVIFLTPDQQKASKGPDRQCIVGAAGTGKTIVLLVKIRQLIDQGKSVTIFSPDGCQSNYQQLLDQSGVDEKNYKIRPLSELVRGTYRAIGRLEDLLVGVIRRSGKLNTLANSLLCCKKKTNNSNLRAIIKSYIEQEVDSAGMLHRIIAEHVYQYIRDNYAEVRHCNEWLHDDYPHQIIIDDSLDDTSAIVQLERILFPLFLMELARQICPEKVVWLAVDPCFDIDYASPLQWVLSKIWRDFAGRSTSESDVNYSVVVLGQVMSCSEHVFKAAYDPTLARLPTYTPALGHKIQGVQPSLIEKHCITEEKAISAFCDEVVTQIEDLLLHGTYNINDVAVITPWAMEADRVYYGLLQKRRERSRDQNTSAGDCGEKPIFVASSHQVSSLEWPVVIYGDFIHAKHDSMSQYEQYRRYRGMSRATAKLIVIKMIYNEICADY